MTDAVIVSTKRCWAAMEARCALTFSWRITLKRSPSANASSSISHAEPTRNACSVKKEGGNMLSERSTIKTPAAHSRENAATKK